jgi:hypothetical protein
MGGSWIAPHLLPNSDLLGIWGKKAVWLAVNAQKSDIKEFEVRQTAILQ